MICVVVIDRLVASIQMSVQLVLLEQVCSVSAMRLHKHLQQPSAAWDGSAIHLTELLGAKC